MKKTIKTTTIISGLNTAFRRYLSICILTPLVMMAGCQKSKDSNTTNSTNFTCGNTFTVTHTAGSVAPETKTITYHTFSSNLTGSTKCWITQNLGADIQPTSVEDTSSKARGWYWQFNRKQGYAIKLDSIGSYGLPIRLSVIPASSWDTTISEHSDWDSTNDPCTCLLGKGWRLPTRAELTAQLAAGGWTNADAAFGSPFFLSNSLSVVTTTEFNYSGAAWTPTDWGAYWSSNENDVASGYNLLITNYGGFTPSGQNEVISSPKINAFPVRCIKD